MVIDNEFAQVQANAPEKVRAGLQKIGRFCEQFNASLLLFGSRAKGHASRYSDWDLGVYFNQDQRDQELRRLKLEIEDQSFPYTLDLVNFNRVSPGALSTMLDRAQLIKGVWPEAFAEYRDG